MTEMFRGLDDEKKKRILNAAYREFSEHGYDEASTNRIVKEAGIGKGMLFYYFHSKKELYHDLTDSAIRYITEEYLQKVGELPGDYIERYKCLSRVKMEEYAENPHLMGFLGNVYINQDAVELPEELRERLDDMRRHAYSLLFEHIDYSLFREDMPPEKICRLIRWSLNGYEKDVTERLKGKNLMTVDYKPYLEELYGYLDDLKKIFYKQGV